MSDVKRGNTRSSHEVAIKFLKMALESLKASSTGCFFDLPLPRLQEAGIQIGEIPYVNAQLALTRETVTLRGFRCHV